MTIGKEFRLNRRHFLGLTAGLIQPLAKFRAVVPAPARNVPPTEASLEDDRTVIEVPGSILSENQKPGTDAWQIVNPATNHEIEGFADHVSVNRGDTINLFVNSPYSDYQLRFLRLGWYGGKGAREIRPPAVMPGVTQSAPHIDGDGQIECHWSPTIPLDIPSDWPTGVYLVKLTAASSGRESYITFTVRDDAGVADLLFQSSVTTYQAYNNWGGKSLYDYNSTSQQYAHKVSFNRPYRRGYGAGDLFFWEIHLLRFLEREGYDVSYTTDVDTHERGHLLRNHLGFLVVGHDEYWSWEMRRNAETALENGVSLGFFGANACYWQIRFESDLRTIIAYKDDAGRADPYFRDPALSHLATTRWRDAPVNRPEGMLLGSQYDFSAVDLDGVVVNAGHWIWKNTGVADGDRIPGVVGYEVDGRFGNEPEGTETVMSTPYVHFDGKRSDATMTTYGKRVATVVNTGTMQWVWGLDGFQFSSALDKPGRYPLRSFENTVVKQATRNILKRFGAVPGPRRAMSGRSRFVRSLIDRDRDMMA